MKVIALDPGVTTGYAVGLLSTGNGLKEPMGVVSGQAKWDELAMYNELIHSKADIIIYERFEHRPGLSHAELFSRNLIGVIELYCKQNGITPYKQMPAYAIGKGAYFKDNRLKQNNVYKVANPHANDAMRHLLQWFMFGAGFQYQPNKEGFRSLA